MNFAWIFIHITCFHLANSFSFFSNCHSGSLTETWKYYDAIFLLHYSCILVLSSLSPLQADLLSCLSFCTHSCLCPYTQQVFDGSFLNNFRELCNITDSGDLLLFYRKIFYPNFSHWCCITRNTTCSTIRPANVHEHSCPVTHHPFFWNSIDYIY